MIFFSHLSKKVSFLEPFNTTLDRGRVQCQLCANFSKNKPKLEHGEFPFHADVKTKEKASYEMIRTSASSDKYSATVVVFLVEKSRFKF